MRRRPIFIGLVNVLLASISAAVIQQPFSTPSFETADEYQFKWPIRRVAIIGAGPGGLVAYRELAEAGFDVRIFERDSVPGGTWHYTEEVALDAPMPNAPCAIADFVPSLPLTNIDLPYSEEFEDDGKIWRDHRGPAPIWESLTSNVASRVQQIVHWPWPAGTQWELTHYQIRNYFRSYASYLNINSNDGNTAAAYNTRVELVEKRINEAGDEQGWRLWLRSLEPTGHRSYNATWWTEDFDAVVVAVGKYNAPSMPSIPGLEDWVRRFPGLVRHGRQYRRPEPYTNQTVLIIGAAASGSEISRDLNHHARQVYQSIRPKTVTSRKGPNHLRRVPNNTTFIGEIEQFLPIPEGSPIQSGLVELKNGTIITGIDGVILATGYRFSFPFLPQYYDDATYVPHEGSAKTVSPFLPLGGSYFRDMYLNVFYIRDPTLAFIGMSSGTPALSLQEYLALAMAKVWSNTAKLPSNQTMWERYEKIVEERGGYGKQILFLGPQGLFDAVRDMVGWLNEAAVKYGGKQVDGLPKYTTEVFHYWGIAHFGEPERDTTAKADEEVVISLGLTPVEGVDQYDPIYDDIW